MRLDRRREKGRGAYYVDVEAVAGMLPLLCNSKDRETKIYVLAVLNELSGNR